MKTFKEFIKLKEGLWFTDGPPRVPAIPFYNKVPGGQSASSASQPLIKKMKKKMEK